MKIKLSYGELEYNKKTGEWAVVSGGRALQTLLPIFQDAWRAVKSSGSPRYASPLVEKAVQIAEAFGGELSGTGEYIPRAKNGVVN